jgi:Na+-driven multidrug efflux pump
VITITISILVVASIMAIGFGALAIGAARKGQRAEAKRQQALATGTICTIPLLYATIITIAIL